MLHQARLHPRVLRTWVTEPCGGTLHGDSVVTFGGRQTEQRFREEWPRVQASCTAENLEIGYPRSGARPNRSIRLAGTKEVLINASVSDNEALLSLVRRPDSSV